MSSLLWIYQGKKEKNSIVKIIFIVFTRSNDGLQTSFQAFKIPESNFLVFEATVKSCRSGCRPVSKNLYLFLLHKSENLRIVRKYNREFLF